MENPPGYHEILEDLGGEYKELLDGLTDEDICELFRTIYGLVQAALCWYKKIAATLIDDLGYARSKSDPCLFYRCNEKGECIVLLYVDDSALLGEEAAVEETYKKLKLHYTVKIKDMDEYIGCKFEPTEKGLLLHQPRLLKRLQKNSVKNLRNYLFLILLFLLDIL